MFFRAFIYNYYNESDWRNDRAKDAVDYFQGLDGKFEDNVVIQIKYGPLDFQVREPPNALFAHLQQTNVIIEVEVSQEYLGQQNHLVYEPPLWKTIYDFGKCEAPRKLPTRLASLKTLTIWPTIFPRS